MLKIIKDNILKLKLKNKHYKLMTMFFFMFVVGGLFLGVSKVSAQWSITGIARDAVLNSLSWIMQWVTTLLLKVSFWSLEYIKAIAQYNNFMDAPPVVLGWLMVRDIANMFFVVILLVIAFGTILGLEQYEWKRSLIKLVLAAIFINFSKLILQLVIDASQVFTITFFNAFSASSGGNFIEMFKMDAISKMIVPEGTGSAADKEALASQVFAASVMGVFMAATVLATLGAYLVILIARVVMLWILMVLSPLAFILQTIPAGKKYADDFWQKFVHHVLVAPVMFFFLWLAFATLGNGNIATQVGINTSQASQAGAEFSNASGITGNPSVSMSEATTWENLSSFAMAIGFLLAGLTFVQSLGVVGGGLTQKATQFGMAVATIASGYSAGRWLAGKGKEAGSDYAKLAWGKSGGALLRSDLMQKIPVARNIANVVIGQSKENRQLALKNLERRQQAQSARALAGGATGLAGALSVDKKRTVEIEKETGFIKERKAEEEKRFGAEATKNMIRDDHRKMAENKIGGMELAVGIKFEELGSNDKLRPLYDKYVEQMKSKDSDAGIAAVGTLQKIDEALMEDDRFKGKYTNQEIRKVDRKAAEGTFMIARELEEQYAGEEVMDEQSRKRDIKGLFELGYEKNEIESYKEKIGKTRRNLAVEKYLSKEGKKTPEQIARLNEKEKQEIFDSADFTAEKKYEHLESITPAELAAEFEKRGEFDDLAKYGTAFRETRSKTKINKYTTEAGVSQSRVADLSRGMEGKSTDELKNAEIVNANKMFAEYADTNSHTIERFSKDIKSDYDDMVKLEEEIKNKEKIPGADVSAEKKQLKSKTQKQAERVFAFQKRFTGGFAGIAGSLGKSFKKDENGENREIISQDNLPIAEIAMIMGKTFDEVLANPQKAEEEMHRRFELKDDRLMAMGMLAHNGAGAEGYVAHGGQIIEAVDGSNTRRMVYARNARKQIGEGEVAGTGHKDDDGVKVRKNYVKGNILKEIDATSIKDARALYNMTAAGPEGVNSDESRAAIIAAIATGRGLNGSLNNKTILGAGYMETAYDGNSFHMTQANHAIARPAYEAGLATLAQAKAGTTTKASRLEVLKDRLRYADVENVVRKSDGQILTLDEAKEEDIVNFIQEKIIQYKPQTSGGSTPPPPPKDAYDEPEEVADENMSFNESPPPLPSYKSPRRVQSKTKPEVHVVGETKIEPPIEYDDPGRKGEQITQTEIRNTERNRRETQEALNLNKVLKQITEDLKVFSASLADTVANIPQMSLEEEKRIKGIVADRGGMPSAEKSAPVDYNIGKTISEAMKGSDDKIRTELNQKISTLKDSREKNEAMDLLTKAGSLEDADIIKLGRVFRQALESAEKDKPKV